MRLLDGVKSGSDARLEMRVLTCRCTPMLRINYKITVVLYQSIVCTKRQYLAFKKSRLSFFLIFTHHVINIDRNRSTFDFKDRLFISK